MKVLRSDRRMSLIMIFMALFSVYSVIRVDGPIGAWFGTSIFLIWMDILFMISKKHLADVFRNDIKESMPGRMTYNAISIFIGVLAR